MATSFGLGPERILEGYSMTEISAFMLRCDHGRFHIPPYIEPLLLDEAWTPLSDAAVAAGVRGIFAFMDPLAACYPGFIVSGDEVRMVRGDCACGLSGPAITEIGRARSREVKGCGGIMASVAA